MSQRGIIQFRSVASVQFVFRYAESKAKIWEDNSSLTFVCNFVCIWVHMA
jgi:hypothetical protein